MRRLSQDSLEAALESQITDFSARRERIASDLEKAQHTRDQLQRDLDAAIAGKKAVDTSIAVLRRQVGMLEELQDMSALSASGLESDISELVASVNVVGN